jgi:DNA primase
MSRKALDELKRQIPLLDYLQAHDWQPAWRIAGGRLMGLCPLHTDRKPSFLVDPNKNLFFCYGCSRGGDVIRFAEIYHQVKFLGAVALLREWCGLAPLLDQVTDFYRIQLHRHFEAISYLSERGLHLAQGGMGTGSCRGEFSIAVPTALHLHAHRAFSTPRH